MDFSYQARDAQGKVAGGTLAADTIEEATSRLRRDGLYIIQISPVVEDEGGGALDFWPFRPRIKRQEIIYFANQLAVLVDTGVTLSVALQNIGEQTVNPAFQNVLDELRADVEAGEDFSRALARQRNVFDEVFVQLVRAGESTGGLGKMLIRIAAYSRQQFETRHKVKVAMAYPLVMLTMAIGVSIFLLAYVFPKFAPIFEARSLDLPTPTRIMMAISHALTDYWYLIIGGTLAVVVGAVLIVRTGPGRMALDFVKIYTPVIGQMFRKASISRSLRTMATMVNGGVPMLEALELSGRVAGNVHYQDLWTAISHRVVGGQQICDAIGRHPLFPPMLVQMISAGEQAGQLGQVLDRVSDFYDEELETTVKGVTSIIEPIMVAVMGVVVGGVAMALLLPIFTLSRAPK